MKRRILIAVACVLCVAAASRAPSISIDVRDARLGDVIFMLAAQSGMNIIADTSVSGERVTLRVRDAGFDRVLHLLAVTHNLRLIRDRNIYLLSSSAAASHPATPPAHPDPSQAERRLSAVVIPPNPLDAANVMPSASNARVGARLISLHFTKPSAALDALYDLLPAATYIPDDPHRNVTIIGSASAVNDSSYLLESADSRRQRVLLVVRALDVRIAEQQDNLAQELSDAPVTRTKDDPLYAFLRKTRALERDLRFLVDVGRAHGIASRRIVTSDGRHANLAIGGPIGAELDIRPALTDSGISVEIAARYSLPPKAGVAAPSLSGQSTYSFHAAPNQSIIVGGFFNAADPHIKEESCVVITPLPLGQQLGSVRPHKRGAPGT